MEKPYSLSVNQVQLDFKANSKKKVLERVAELVAIGSPSVSSITIAEGFFARERLGSTNLGFGVALPHTRVADLTQATAAFLRLLTPIDFDNSAQEAVDLIVGLVVPENANETHLQALSQLASCFKDASLREQLRATKSAQTAQKLLIN